MDTKALREEFGTAQKEAQDVISLASKEGRKLTAEEQTANDKRFARMDLIKSQFDEQARFAKLSLEAGTAVLPGEPDGRKEFEQSEGRIAYADASGKFDMDKCRNALNHFARTGDVRQLFTITTGTSTAAFLPKQVLQPVTIRRLQNVWRGVLAAFDVKPIETDSLAAFSLPVGDDTGNVGQSTAEDASSGTAADVNTSGSLSFSPTLWDSKAQWFSNSMVMASSFDVISYTLPMLQKRIEKITESTFTTKVINNGNVGRTLASTTAITYADLIAWEHSLAPAYRSDACFAVSDSCYQAMRGIVDDVHRPVLDQSPNDAFQAKFHGKPIIVGDYFQTMAAAHTVGAFVSADAIKIVDVMNQRIARYAGLPAYPDQVGFQMFANGDFNFVLQGLSLLKCAAS